MKQTNALLMVLALIFGSAAAQLNAQEAEDDLAADTADLSREVCEPRGEGVIDAEDGEDLTDGDPLSDECEQAGEEAGDDLAEIELPTGMGDIVEEDPAVRASADDVFEPGEEISEDFPVPLPSDI